MQRIVASKKLAGPSRPKRKARAYKAACKPNSRAVILEQKPCRSAEMLPIGASTWTTAVNQHMKTTGFCR